MFVQCPKCDAQYKIPEGVILPKSGKFQCSACKEVFVEKDLNKFKNIDDTAICNEKLIKSTLNSDEVLSENLNKEQDDMTALTTDSVVLNPSPSQGHDFEMNSLPEAFVPIVEGSSVGKGKTRKIILFLIFLFVVIAGIFLYYKPATHALEDAIVRFTKDMMPNVLLKTKETPKMILNVQGKKQQKNKDFKSGKRRKTLKDNNTKEKTDAIVPESKQRVEQITKESSAESEVVTVAEVPDVQGNDINESAVSASVIADKIKIRGVSFRYQMTDEGAQVVVVEGMVFNLSDQRVSLPVLLVQLKDKEDKVVYTGEITLSESETASKHAQSFSGIFPFVADVTQAVVELK